MASDDPSGDDRDTVRLSELEWIRDLVQSFNLPTEGARLAAMMELYELLVAAKRLQDDANPSSDE